MPKGISSTLKVDPGTLYWWRFTDLNATDIYWSSTHNDPGTLAVLTKRLEQCYRPRLKLVLKKDGQQYMFIGTWQNACRWVVDRFYVDA